MKIAQIISEASLKSILPDEMNATLRANGYRYIDSGVEHSVWRGPDGYVYKIMSPRYIASEVAKKLQFGFTDPTEIYLTRSQQCFIDFVGYCQKNKNNKFLPYYDDWSVHVRKTHRTTADNKPLYYAYIQARTEALFPLKGRYSEWGRTYTSICYWPDEALNRLKRGEYNTQQLAAISHLGNERGLKQFINTIRELSEIAKNKGYALDFHEGNFMFGSDGHVVINDPFFVKYQTSESPPFFFSTSDTSSS